MKTIEEQKKIIIENSYFLNTEDLNEIKKILKKYEKQFNPIDVETFKYYDLKLIGNAKSGLRRSLISCFNLNVLNLDPYKEGDNPDDNIKYDELSEREDLFYNLISSFMKNLPNWILNTSIELNKDLDDKLKLPIIRIQKQFIKEEILQLFLSENKQFIKYIKNN